MIVPIQRYPRYPLFFSRLLKNVNCCECDESQKEIKDKLTKLNKSLQDDLQTSEEAVTITKDNPSCSSMCNVKSVDENTKVKAETDLKFTVQEINETETKLDQLKI